MKKSSCGGLVIRQATSVRAQAFQDTIVQIGVEPAEAMIPKAISSSYKYIRKTNNPNSNINNRQG